MTSLSRIFRELNLCKSLKSIWSKYCYFSGNNIHFSAYNSVTSSLCNNLAEEEKISLQDIENVDPSQFNFNAEKWTKLLKEVSQAKALGKKLPNSVKINDLNDILEYETHSQRLKHLKYLHRNEKKRENSIEKKLRKKADLENKSVKNVPVTDHIEYGLGKNTLILRAQKRKLIKYYEKRLANAVLFGQKLVIDMGYDKYMTVKERKNCAVQVRMLHSHNRLNSDPYDLYFCNADPESGCIRHLKHLMPNLDDSFVSLVEQSYVNVFPKEDLVYLSPHAPETLKSYDPKAVYIIGGFVDTVKREKVSIVKALEDGIKSYSLPLDQYVSWGSGSRSLSINQVFSIMQTFRDTGDWREAFKHVPARKLKNFNPNAIYISPYNEKKLSVTESN